MGGAIKKYSGNGLPLRALLLGPCGRPVDNYSNEKRSSGGRGFGKFTKRKAKFVEQDEEKRVDVIEDAVQPEEHFMLTVHPDEPVMLDSPIRCPQPEPSIINDGPIWKERLRKSRRHAGQLQFLTRNDVKRLHQKHGLIPRELIFPSVSAPEASLIKMLQ